MKIQKKAGNRILAVLLCLCCLLSLFVPATVKADTGNYYLKVNKGTNVVTVYKQDGTPYTAFTCSTGSATPLGTYYTPAKYRWWTLDGPSYGQYCTRITGGFLFHSVWYYAQTYDSQSYVQYNKLGQTASHGCTRLTVAAAKWIYENCPLGTKVIIFNGTSADDPLGKPKTITVNAAAYRGWDPTDPDPANPYATGSSQPSIKADSKIKLQYGSEFHLSDYVHAYDSAGNELDSVWLRTSGSVNTNQMGTYKVTYSLTDSFGRDAVKTVTYLVGDTAKATISGVQSKVTREYRATYKLRSKITAKNALGQNLTSNIQVRLKKPGDTDYKKTSLQSLKLAETGKYKVQYSVKNPSNKLVTTKTTTIIVKDTKKPIFTSEDDFKAISLPAGTTSITYKKLMSGVTAALRSGKNMTSKISIKVTDPNGKVTTVAKNSSYTLKEAGKYKITYYCANTDKNLSTGNYMIAKKNRRMVLAATKVSSMTDTFYVPETTEFTAGTELDLFADVSVTEETDWTDNTHEVSEISEGISVTKIVFIDAVGRSHLLDVTDLNVLTLEEGRYRILYEYTNSRGKTTKYVRRLTVAAAEAEAEEGVESEEASDTQETAADTEIPDASGAE